MQITKVRIRLIQNKDRLKAVASITLDDALILNDIRIIQTDDRLCVDFPKNPYARDKNHIQYVIVPISMDVRSEFETHILDEYRKMVSAFTREVV